MTDQVRARVLHLLPRASAVALGIIRAVATRERRAQPHVQAAARVCGALLLRQTERVFRFLRPLFAAGCVQGRRLYERLTLRQKLFTAVGCAACTLVLALVAPQPQGTAAPITKIQTTPTSPPVERRWRMASHPSLATWSRAEGNGPQALRYVEQQIAARNGGAFRTAMTVNPALMTLTEQTVAGRPMQTALYENRVKASHWP